MNETRIAMTPRFKKAREKMKAFKQSAAYKQFLDDVANIKVELEKLEKGGRDGNDEFVAMMEKMLSKMDMLGLTILAGAVTDEKNLEALVKALYNEIEWRAQNKAIESQKDSK